MGDSNNRFKFLKKLSSRIEDIFLGDMIKSKEDNLNDNVMNDYNNSMLDDYLFNHMESNIQENILQEDNFKEENNYSKNNSFVDGLNNDKYSKYIYLDEFEDTHNSIEDLGLNVNKSNEYFEYENNLGFENNLNEDNLSLNRKLGNFNEDNSKFLTNLKNKLLNSDNSFKRNFGLISVILIILVIGSSIFYFGIFQPFQNELNTEKTAKLNELNTLYKGPLELNSHYYELKNQIEDSFKLEDIRLIDILRLATGDWRKYHLSKINEFSDPYGRIMMSYAENNSKKILMPCDDAKLFVKENDGKILSNILFEKVDTVIVPISINRLQATGGLISVGSIVDIYSLSSNDSYYSPNSDSGPDDSTSDNSNSNSEENTSENSSTGNSDENNSSSADQEHTEDYSNEPDSFDSNENQLSVNENPDISGATILAILRSKDSGVVDSNFAKSTNLVRGNETYPTEKSTSFSTDVEELLKSSIFNGQSDDILSSYLNNYGIKLSNYERLSNIGELDTNYLILLEVPRSDVSFIINNMDNLILTIPTEYAPNWAIDELSSTYYNELNYNPNN